MNKEKYCWELRDLGLSYGQGRRRVQALSGLNLQFEQGETLAVTGPSGCGKSSLLAMLGAMQIPGSGECRFGGQSLAAMTSAQRAHYRAETVGFVFQQFCLLPHLSLLDNVLLGVDHLPARRPEFLQYAQQLLERVGVAELSQRLPHQVSGGQAQRAAIARALLRKPRLILADEPTGALDEASAERVFDLLLALAGEGSALVLVTHSEALAARLPRRVRLNAGRLQADEGLRPVCA